MKESIAHIAPVWPNYFGIIAERGEGTYLYSTDGQVYLDFTCGIAVTNTGHCHPRVVAAIREQAGKLLHGQANIVRHQPLLGLIQELRTIVPPGLDSFFFKSSGSETIEAAIKLARMASGRTNIIVFQGSFHGRTIGTMSLTTSKTVYRAGFQPLMPGVFVAPFPYTYRYGWEPEQTVKWCLDELRYLLLSQTAPSETAAMLIEPVLGEGGYVVPPQGFLQGLRQICDEHGILLIIDEIQSGFGRTGRWFAHQHYDVTPDMMVIAKGLASGLPLAGIAARQEIMQRCTPGSEGGTYGGNAVACAAGIASIQAMKEEKLIENSAARGEQLMAGLRQLQAKYPGIGEVRGLGLMVGVEFTDAQGKPDKTSAKAFQKACFEEKLLILTCGTYDNIIRVIPPLVVTAEQIEDGLARFDRALAKVYG